MSSRPRPAELGSIESRVGRQPLEAFFALLDYACDRIGDRIAQHQHGAAPLEPMVDALGAAAFMGTDRETVYRLAKAGVLPCKPPDEHWHTWRFSLRALDEWASRQVEPQPTRRRRAA